MDLPLTFDPVSNGEYLPPRKTARHAAMEKRARELAERGVRRTGMDRRAFLASTSGMAACLAAINEASARSGGSYVLPKEAVLDPAAADSALAGDEFIFDIQTHHTMPGRGWARPGGRYEFIKEIFLDSDTTCAVLSALPAVEEKQPLPQAEAEVTREIIERVGSSPRLWVHAIVTPNYGDVQRHLDGMERISKQYKIAAWKMYTLMDAGPNGGFWHHDEKLGIPVIEKAREIGIKILCTHKGLPFGKRVERYDTAKDIGIVAKRYPDMKFIVYHSGYIGRRKEGPYDPANAEEGVDAFVKSLEENGIKPGSNVYAEIGSTWWLLMKKPDEAAHVVGKLLKAVGPDNFLWGTDSIWYGSPQPQIAAFRAFQIGEELREKHGYPELTKELKAKIFGLSSAKVYGVDPKRDLPKIRADEVEKLKQSYLPNRNPSHTVYGPRTRREFFQLLALRGGFMA